MRFDKMIFGRLVASVIAAGVSAFVILILYVVTDLYLTGHNLVEVGKDVGTPLHYIIFSVLLFVVPIAVGVGLFYLTGRKEDNKKPEYIHHKT